MTRAAPPGPIDVYGRVSRKGDKAQRSTTGQVQVCRAVLDERGLPVGAVFVDDGRSAWNPKVRRDGWDKLMARLESGVSGGCIVYDMSRFSRRPSEGERLIAAAERGLLILDSESEYDLCAPNGKKQFRDMLSAAAYYSDDLQRKVKRGKRVKAMARKVDRGAVFGFEDDGVTIREDEAAILRQLTARFLAGESQDILIDWLNAEGIRTARGKPWSRTPLRALLTRPRNAGHIVHNGVIVGKLPARPIVHETDCEDDCADPEHVVEGEPIIDPDDFTSVIAKYAARRPGRPPSPRYLCSGHAYCGLCSSRLVGRPRTSSKPYSDGEPKREYMCRKTGYYAGCGRISIDQRGMDELARELTVRVLSDPRHASQVAAAAARHEEEAGRLDAAITEAEGVAEALADRLGRGEMDLSRFDAAVKPLDERLAKLRAERAALSGPGAVPGAGIDWAARWKAGGAARRRAMLTLALRGRRLLVGPADPFAWGDIAGRVELADPS